jgi:hypothetical protein
LVVTTKLIDAVIDPPPSPPHADVATVAVTANQAKRMH